MKSVTCQHLWCMPSACSDVWPKVVLTPVCYYGFINAFLTYFVYFICIDYEYYRTKAIAWFDALLHFEVLKLLSQFRFSSRFMTYVTLSDLVVNNSVFSFLVPSENAAIKSWNARSKSRCCDHFDAENVIVSLPGRKETYSFQWMFHHGLNFLSKISAYNIYHNFKTYEPFTAWLGILFSVQIIQIAVLLLLLILTLLQIWNFHAVSSTPIAIPSFILSIAVTTWFYSLSTDSLIQLAILIARCICCLRSPYCWSPQIYLCSIVPHFKHLPFCQ